MKPALQIRTSQQLTLTPQLQQSIRLLQLSQVELQAEINSLLEANPLLDHADEPSADGDDGLGDDATAEDSASDAADAEIDVEIDVDDIATEDYAAYSSTGFNEDGDRFERVQEQDLHDHLLWQLNLTPMPNHCRIIATAMIEAIDDDGYLHESDDDILRCIGAADGINIANVAAVREQLRRFDPPGVASRDLRECLAIQLQLEAADTPALALAVTLVDAHLPTLARIDRARVCRQLDVDANTLDQAIELIRSLNPRPGSAWTSRRTEYIIPDAYATKVDGRWQASLAPNCQPQLLINNHYANLAATARGADGVWLRDQLQEARWLIKSLESRADTMLKVARSIVRAQEAFLEYGPEAMRPLVLRNVAEEVQMHESTISRVTTRKYLHTPRGTFEFKYFFSSAVTTIDGGSASATAIQAMIQKLVDEEPAQRPLSDQALANVLNERGINVARRTVAKYREALQIPSSTHRSRLD